MRLLFVLALSIHAAACAYDPLGIESGGDREDAGSETGDASEVDCENDTCDPPDDDKCDNDSKCPRGQICNEAGSCEVGCRESGDCDAPEICHPEKRLCEACSPSNPCPTGDSCVDGVCGPSCTRATCQDDLGPDAYCNEAGKCVSNDCLIDTDCPNDGICDRNTNKCVSAGACVSDNLAECQSECLKYSKICDVNTCFCGPLIPCEDNAYCSGYIEKICDNDTQTCVDSDACVNSSRSTCNGICQGQNEVCDPSDCKCRGKAEVGHFCVNTRDCRPGLACFVQKNECITASSCAQTGSTLLASLGLLALWSRRRRLNG